MVQGLENAMLLAAGLGTRLKPLTLSTPKPLLPLDGTVLIDHQLRYLAAGGIKRVVINLHHLGHMIRDYVGDGTRYDLEILYSDEPEILGTGGGIKKAARFFSRKPFVALNADALIAADLGEVMQRHASSTATATMVLKELGEGEDYTPVSVDPEGRVTGFGEGFHFFTGLSVLGPEIFEALPSSGTPACLIDDGFKVMIERKGKVRAYAYEGYFNDLGTPERYEQAKRNIESNEFSLSE